MGQLGTFAVEKLGVRNCAFLTANNEGYQLQYRSIRDAIVPRAQVAADESVKGAEPYFAAVATKIVARQPDCVVINLTPESTPTPSCSSARPLCVDFHSELTRVNPRWKTRVSSEWKSTAATLLLEQEVRCLCANHHAWRIR